jgi:hypothetical protein
MGMLEKLVKEAEELVVDFIPAPFIGDEYEIQILSRAAVSKNGDQLVPFTCKPLFTEENKQKLYDVYELSENKEYKFFVDKKVKLPGIIKLAKAKKFYDPTLGFVYGMIVKIRGAEVKNPKDKTKFSEDVQGRFYTINIVDINSGKIEFEDPGLEEEKSTVAETVPASESAGVEIREMFE